MNWHLPVAEQWALELKTLLVRTLDQFDISTYGLTFGISNYNRDGHYFTSIVVEKNSLPQDLQSIKIRDTYNVLYARNFDPNTREYQVHVQDVDKLELPTILIELSKKYFEELGSETPSRNIETSAQENEMQEVYQCQDCLTIYNAKYGDLTQNIAAGTLFQDLAESYCCSICEAAKENFEVLLIEM